MQTYKKRLKEEIINRHLTAFPAVVLLGARQVGKSTLAKKIIENISNAMYLDLEDPRDYAKLQEPLAFLEANSDLLICIDNERFSSSFAIFAFILIPIVFVPFPIGFVAMTHLSLPCLPRGWHSFKT